MTNFDWVLAGLFAAFVLYGYYRGFVSQIVSIAGLFLAYLVAVRGFPLLAPLLRDWLPIRQLPAFAQVPFIEPDKMLEYVYNAIAFAVIFIAVKLALGVIGHVLDLAARIPGLKFLNRIGGAALAAVEGAAIIVIAVEIMVLLPSPAVQIWLDHSVIAEWVHQQLPFLMNDWKKGTWA